MLESFSLKGIVYVFELISLRKCHDIDPLSYDLANAI